MWHAAGDDDVVLQAELPNDPKGLLSDCPTKLTMPYDIAKNMFIKGDQSAAMQAFMSGQIKIEGDMSRLMAMQSQGSSMGGEGAAAAQAKLREITSDFE